MNKEIIVKMNKHIRKSRPFLKSNVICDVFRNGTFLEIAFMSKRCKNDAAGSCIMCDYGSVNGAQNYDAYLREMDAILQSEKGIEHLLLCTNGSIMDFSQIPRDIFYKIIEHAGKTDISNIIIEAHYLDITNEKLQKVKQLLLSKNVTIELGMETACQKYQDYIIMKQIDMQKFEAVITNIQSHEFSVDVNILFGLPFLSEKEQLLDTKNAISWAFEHNCNAVLFPINVKPYTLLMNMYENGYYKPVSHWQLLLLLDEIEPEQLSRITISYYGNREENFYDKNHRAILPECCPICKNPLMDFYDAFYKEDHCFQKKNLLNHILNFNKCECLKKQKERLSYFDEHTFEEKYINYTDFLQSKLTESIRGGSL